MGRGAAGSSLDPEGASRVAQAVDNVAALGRMLFSALRAVLRALSAPPARLLYNLFTPLTRQQLVFGSNAVALWWP